MSRVHCFRPCVSSPRPQPEGRDERPETGSEDVGWSGIAWDGEAFWAGCPPSELCSARTRADLHTHTHTRAHTPAPLTCLGTGTHSHIRTHVPPAHTFVHSHSCTHTHLHTCIHTHVHFSRLQDHRLHARPRSRDGGRCLLSCLPSLE